MVKLKKKYHWIIGLINQLEEIGEKQLLCFGLIGDQHVPQMNVSLSIQSLIDHRLHMVPR